MRFYACHTFCLIPAEGTPRICHNHHNRWLCKSFESSVKFSTGCTQKSALSVIFYRVCNLTQYMVYVVFHPHQFYTMCNLTSKHTYHNFHTIHDLSSRIVVYAVLSRGNFWLQIYALSSVKFPQLHSGCVKKVTIMKYGLYKLAKDQEAKKLLLLQDGWSAAPCFSLEIQSSLWSRLIQESNRAPYITYPPY